MFKKMIGLLFLLTMVFVITIPVNAEDRSVIKVNILQMIGFGFGFEKEFQSNYSLIIDGSYDSGGNDHITYSTKQCIIGGRFYNGEESGRLFEGLYYSFTYADSEDKLEDQLNNYRYTCINGVIASLGYELRFGKAKNLCISIESGYVFDYLFDSILTRELNIAPTFGIEAGFNI